MTDYGAFYSNQANSDPTRTLTLRSRWVADWDRRIKALQKVISIAVIDMDVFGMNDLNPRKEAGLETMATLEPPPSKFAYRWSHEKISAFMDWLKEMEDRSLLEVIQRPGTLRPQGEPWSNVYVRSAYQRGLEYARSNINRRSAEIATKMGLEGLLPPAFRPTGGAISAIMQQPFHADRLALAYTRVFDELKGVTAAMDQQISRVLTRSVAEGLNPREIGKLLAERVDAIGRTRGTLIARTETINIHQNAALNEYYSIEKSTGEVILAQWRATLDSRVRDKHLERNGRVYTKEEAYPLLGEPNCLVDGQIKIYTSTGWKSIRDIVAGDLVLTHKGRFRKVTQTHKNRAPNNQSVVEMFWGTNQSQRLTVTDNHPILLNGRWAPAYRAAKSVRVSYLARECKRADCSNLTPHYSQYCSSSCSSKDIADGQWSRSEHRENISSKASAQMKREYSNGVRNRNTITLAAIQMTRERSANGEFILQQSHIREIIRKVTNTPEIREQASKHMSNLYSLPEWREKLSKRTKDFIRANPDKHPLALLAKSLGHKGFISSLEEKVKTVLDRVGLAYIQQFPISTYRVDFAIPSMRLVIECDGKYWHGTDEQKERDRVRDAEITENGWLVIRYTEDMINDCLEEIEHQLVRISSNHSGEYRFIDQPLTKVIRRTLKRRNILWNLTVEEDESYIANGFVVHNCRCALLPYIPATQGMPTKVTNKAREACREAIKDLEERERRAV